MSAPENKNDPPYGASNASPLEALPSSPPTYDPATRLFAPLPDPPPVAAGYAPREDSWWSRPGPLAAIAAAIALVVASGVLAVFLVLEDDPEQLVSLGGGNAVAGAENLTLRDGALNVQGVLGVVSPSVVSIETNASTIRGVFGGAGSGIVVDTNGLILTNAHVVEDADNVEVVFFDGTRAPARVASSIVEDDIALLQVQGVTDTLPATLGSSEDLFVGDQVLAIGNALGLGGDPTVTLGILSAKNRQIDAGRLEFDSLLQTDAAINPGNSGGPLVNAAGEVIGINTAIIEGSQNVGFAIAIDSVLPFLDGFATGDASLTPDTAWFGASSRALTQVPAREQNNAGVTSESGVFIIDVFGGSAADRAGLVPGDVILSINGAAVANPEDVGRLIRALDPGNVVDIEFERSGSTMTSSVALGTRADASNGD